MEHGAVAVAVFLACKAWAIVEPSVVPRRCLVRGRELLGFTELSSLVRCAMGDRWHREFSMDLER